MANHLSSKKRIRQSETRRIRNKYYVVTMRNALKRFRGLEEKAAAEEQYPKLVSLLDKLAKRNLIHKKKADNLKSKLALYKNSLS